MKKSTNFGCLQKNREVMRIGWLQKKRKESVFLASNKNSVLLIYGVCHFTGAHWQLGPRFRTIPWCCVCVITVDSAVKIFRTTRFSFFLSLFGLCLWWCKWRYHKMIKFLAKLSFITAETRMLDCWSICNE